jgi:agmatine deiminase
MQTPDLQNQVLPPEWVPQSAVQLTWPHAQGDWAWILDEAEADFTRIAIEISRRQTLLVACHDPAVQERVRARLQAAGAEMTRVRLYRAPSNDTWARDHGPITVLREGRPRLLNFRFNGWGGKYPHDLDNQLTQRLHEQGAYGGTPLEHIDLVLEGGGIEVNGEGCLLTTESCLLAPTRNPQLTRAEIEQRLKSLLGVHTVHWLKHGALEGDDTDGHIDTLARYAAADTIVFQDCNDVDDPHFDDIEKMEEELTALRRPDGRRYRLLALPWPQPKTDRGRRLPATYANFLVINGAVLAPTYADPADGLALEVLREAFPDREVVGVDCRALIRQYGSLHCVTMQLPAGVAPENPEHIEQDSRDATG